MNKPTNVSLFEAIENDDIGLIKTILEAGVDVNSIDDDGDTALALAVADASAATVSLLLERGADPSQLASDQFTLWHCAAYNDAPEVWDLLATKNLDINAKDIDGSTPLAHALRDKNLSFAEFSLKNGADANLADNELWTPLHNAASAGDLPAASLLLKYGAQKDVKNNEGGLPCQYVPEEMDDLLMLVIPPHWVGE